MYKYFAFYGVPILKKYYLEKASDNFEKKNSLFFDILPLYLVICLPKYWEYFHFSTQVKEKRAQEQKREKERLDT